MADISTDRLEPTAPAIAPAERQNHGDANGRSPRRRASRPAAQRPEEAEEAPEGPDHEVDQMA